MSKRPQMGEDLLDAHYHAVGMVASAWSLLEFRIDTLIWHLAGVQQMPGACITSQIGSLGARMRTLLALVELRLGDKPKEIYARLNRFLQASYGLQDQRNRIVHDALLFRRDTSQVVSLRTTIKKGKLDFGGKPIPIDEIDETRRSIGEHTNIFLSLNRDIRKTLANRARRWSRPLAHLEPQLGEFGKDSGIEFHARKPPNKKKRPPA